MHGLAPLEKRRVGVQQLVQEAPGPVVDSLDLALRLQFGSDLGFRVGIKVGLGFGLMGRDRVRCRVRVKAR